MADLKNELRRAAEAKLSASVDAADELLHELRVHQIELEMQNENLRQAQVEIEKSRDRYVQLYDFAPVAYLTLNREGMITELNLTAADLFGAERQRLLRNRFSSRVAPENRERWEQYFLTLLKSDSNQDCELSLSRSDGTRFDAHLNASNIGSGVRLALTDLTKLKRIEFARQKQRELDEQEAERKKLEYAYGEWIHALDAVNDPIFMHDREFRVLRCNKAYQKLAGMPFKKIIGQPYYTIYPIAPEPMPCCKQALLQDSSAEEDIKIGSNSYRSRVYPISDEQHNYLYSVHILEDITERKSTQNLLALQARISNVFALLSDDEQFNEVLKVILDATSSPFGVFGYIDTDGALVVPTMTYQVWDRCDIPGKTTRFPQESWGNSSWPRAIREKCGNYSNQPSSGIPQGHVSIQRNMSMPILHQGKVIGLFQTANKASDYTEEDALLLSAIAVHTAPLLYAKLQQARASAILDHTNRVLDARSRVNRAMAHANDEAELMHAFCEAMVDQRGFMMAWAGYVQHDATLSIRVMASSGSDAGFLNSAHLTWLETERGMGGRAVRSGMTQLCQDIAHDPLYLPWREAATANGYASAISLPLFNQENAVFGILNLYADQPYAFIPTEIKLLEETAEDLSFGVRALRIRQERDIAARQLQQRLLQLQDNLDDTINAISTIVEIRDPYTAGHQNRVADLAYAIAKQMRLPDDQTHGIQIAGMVHDLGKIQIPAEILSKPGKISDIEFGLIKQHPRAGFDILKGIDFPWPIAQMVLQHHERLDGSGYPQGLAGDAIMLGARILTVADVVEAISSHRPYRPSLGIEAALTEILAQSNKYYDPQVVAACLAVFREHGYTFK